MLILVSTSFSCVGSNILLSVTCGCQDVLRCSCPADSKYRVMIADYDSIKHTEFRRVAQNIPQVDCVRKTPEQLKKVMGTVAYRAPEVREGGL